MVVGGESPSACRRRLNFEKVEHGALHAHERGPNVNDYCRGNEAQASGGGSLLMAMGVCGAALLALIVSQARAGLRWNEGVSETELSALPGDIKVRAAGRPAAACDNCFWVYHLERPTFITNGDVEVAKRDVLQAQRERDRAIAETATLERQTRVLNSTETR